MNHITVKGNIINRKILGNCRKVAVDLVDAIEFDFSKYHKCIKNSSITGYKFKLPPLESGWRGDYLTWIHCLMIFENEYRIHEIMHDDVEKNTLEFENNMNEHLEYIFDNVMKYDIKEIIIKFCDEVLEEKLQDINYISKPDELNGDINESYATQYATQFTNESINIDHLYIFLIYCKFIRGKFKNNKLAKIVIHDKKIIEKALKEVNKYLINDVTKIVSLYLTFGENVVYVE